MTNTRIRNVIVRKNDGSWKYELGLWNKREKKQSSFVQRGDRTNFNTQPQKGNFQFSPGHLYHPINYFLIKFSFNKH